MFIYLIAAIWFLPTARQILFWLYLWQLKDYHIGRFLDHFTTEKGKKLLLNPFSFLKFFISALFIISILRINYSIVDWLIWVALAIYILEASKVIWDEVRKRILLPVFTKKMIFLVGSGFFAEALFLFFLARQNVNIAMLTFGLLLFDLLIPDIMSITVLVLQPFAVVARQRTLWRARKKRAQIPNLIVIGVTGSYGKTSTKEFLALILSHKFNVLKTKKHQNSEIGVAQCILKGLGPEHEIFIAEMGAYSRGGIKLICKMVQPKIGILTGINQQHMATFGSQENIIKTKFELIESLPQDGIAILNWDNEFIKSKLKNKKPKVQVRIKKFYSIKENLDIWAEDIRIEKEYVSFRGIAKDGDAANFHLNVLGGYHIPNLLAAASCAKELRMTMAEISDACKKINPELTGVILKRGPNGAMFIDATYSANPDGVISHLDYLKIWPGRKAIIMPCLIELGSASKEVHRRIGRKIGEVCDLAVITTKERFYEIKEGAREAGMKIENIFFSENPRKIFEKLKGFSGPENIIVLEGRIQKTILARLFQ